MGDDRLIADGNPLCPGETLTVTPDTARPRYFELFLV